MKISFTEQGEGPSLVLIHGFCETSKLWDSFRSELADHFRVLTPDLPGFGNTALIPGQFSISDVSEAIYAWLTDLDIQKTTVIGHSLGGYVTLALAENHPEVLHGFGLFHSTAYADGQEKKLSRDKTIEFVKDKGVDVFARSFVPQLFYSKNRKWLKEEISRVVDTAAETELETLIAYTKAMRDRPDRTVVLRDFDNPILIMAGDKDTSVPVEAIYEQELLPKKGTVHIFSETGHMGMFENRERSILAIRNFMEYCN